MLTFCRVYEHCFLDSWVRGKGCVCQGVLSCPSQETLPLKVLSETVAACCSLPGEAGVTGSLQHYS